MDKLHLILAGAAVVLTVALGESLITGAAWERKVAAVSDTVKTLRQDAQVAARAAARVDTVRLRLSKVTHDTVLAAVCDTEVADLKTAFQKQVEATGKLQGVLNDRPRLGLTLEALHPSVHIALVAIVYPKPAIGVGLSFDLAKLRL